MADRPSLQRRLRLLIGVVGLVLAAIMAALGFTAVDFQEDVDERDHLIPAGTDVADLSAILVGQLQMATGGAPEGGADADAIRQQSLVLLGRLDRVLQGQPRALDRLEALRVQLLAWTPQTPIVVDSAALADLVAASEDLASEIAAATVRAADLAEASRTRFLWAVGGAASAAIVMLVAGAASLRRWVILPLHSLAEDVARVADGDEGIDLRSEASRELALLADSVARMRDRITAERDRAVRASEAVHQQAPAVAALRTLLEPRFAGVPDGLTVAGGLVPAEGELAGDWYDVAGDGTRLAVVLGDVCGHGIEAGVLAVRTKFAILDSLALGLDPASALDLAARRFARDDTFVTVVVAEIDVAAGTCTYASAGHNPALLVRADGTTDELHRTGPLIGLVDGKRPNAVVPIGPGDLLVLYTDGVIEARDDVGEQLLVRGLEVVLSEQRRAEPERLVEAITGAVLNHCGGRCADDATVVVVRVE